MPQVAQVTDVRVGTTPASRLYAGTVKVWPLDALYPAQVKSLVPVSYWRLGEAAGATSSIDEMGRHPLVYTGSPTLGTTGLLTDDDDTAMTVTGVTAQGGNAANPAEYQLTGEFAVEAWVRTSNAGSSLRSIIVKQNAYGLFTMNNNLCVYEWGSSLIVDTGVNIADGVRHHVVAVFGVNYGPSTSRIYLDGKPVGVTFMHAQLHQSGTLAVGYNDYPSQEFIGTIDEVAVYAHTLTPEQVWANYVAGVVTPPFSPDLIPGLVVWIDPAEDTYTEGEKIASYTEHSAAHRVFLPDARPEYQPIFRTSPPRLEFPNPNFGMVASGVNLGPSGLTFVVVNRFADFTNFPMVLVSGPDADGFELRHDGSTTQIVERYTTHGLAFSHPTPDTAGIDNLHVLRVQGGVRSDVWVNASLHQASAAAGHNQALDFYVARRQGGYYYRGTIVEALVYAGPVSDADLVKLRDYLDAKHNLVALGAV